MEYSNTLVLIHTHLLTSRVLRGHPRYILPHLSHSQPLNADRICSSGPILELCHADLNLVLLLFAGEPFPLLIMC